VTEPDTRIVCALHRSRTAARVDAGVYSSERPFRPSRTLLKGPDGLIGAKRRDRRLPEAMVPDRVELWSDRAMSFTFSPDYWGTLPAWCPDCRETRWPSVEELRSAVKRGHRVLLLDPNDVLSLPPKTSRPGRVAQ
jgi:hypothetical protein